MPGLVKIGRSTRHPSQRLRELYTTGVPTRFELEYCCRVENCDVAERKAHARLKARRESKEFFRCTATEAIAVLETMGITILARESRAEQEAAVRAEIEAIQERTERLARQAAAAAKESAEQERRRRREQSVRSTVSVCIGWPAGLLAAFAVAQVFDWSAHNFLRIAASLVAGVIVGVRVGSVGSSFFAPRFLAQPEGSGFLARVRRRARPGSEKLRGPDWSWFRWWYLPLLVPVLKTMADIVSGH
jgi:hypothetical protein